MKKSLIAAFTLTVGLLGGCAMPAAPSGGTASATSSSGNTTAASEPAGNYRTVWVPPPTGSLLGGGYVRVANNVEGNDETALIGTINELNAAAGTPTERPFVVTAVSRSTGVSERELQVQQDLLQLQFGQLCAINVIAHGNSTKARELATLKSQGRTWTQLAQANGLSIATLVQKARNAREMTVNSYSNSSERAKGGQQKLKSIGLHPQVRPGN